jgi:hypothetical protein
LATFKRKQKEDEEQQFHIQPRKALLGSRLSVTVRFTVAGVTNLRCGFATGFALRA